LPFEAVTVFSVQILKGDVKMSEHENKSIFTELEADGLDINVIFGDSADTPAPPPPVPAEEPEPAPPESTEQEAETAEETKSEPITEAEPEPDTSDEPAEVQDDPEPTDEAQVPEDHSEDGPTSLFSALTSTPEKESEPKPKPAKKASAQTSLFDRPPIFYYGGAKEEIKDSSMTFEELRISKSDDFPELGEGKKVSWTVDYGKSTKVIADPKGTTIARIKEEIEKSKSFMDALRKASTEKERNPECLVKPKVTAQNKGIADYKGLFSSTEDALSSDKTICYIPAKDGRLYEMRKTEMGSFTVLKGQVLDFSEIRAGFTPALPLIPAELMERIITFFRHFMKSGGELEALAHIYWDKEQKEYIVSVPKQTVSKAEINADLSGLLLPEERYIHYADVHSHNSMPAVFSKQDDRDEKATRLYLVVGRLHNFYPEISARYSCGGIYQSIDPALVLEQRYTAFPPQWLEQVKPVSYSDTAGKMTIPLECQDNGKFGFRRC